MGTLSYYQQQYRQQFILQHDILQSWQESLGGEVYYHLNIDEWDELTDSGE